MENNKKQQNLDILRFRYKPKAWLMILVTVFFGGMAFLLYYMAAENDRGLVINHIFTLNVEQATFFLYVLLIFSALFVLIGIVGIYRSLTLEQEITLTNVSIEAPKSGISKKLNLIKFSDIKTIEEINISGQVILTIIHKNGKLQLAKSLCRNEREFEEMKMALYERAMSFMVD